VRDWARWCRRALVSSGVVALALGGVSIFGQPDRVMFRIVPLRVRSWGLD
jgi:hypothetical protein